MSSTIALEEWQSTIWKWFSGAKCGGETMPRARRVLLDLHLTPGHRSLNFDLSAPTFGQSIISLRPQAHTEKQDQTPCKSKVLWVERHYFLTLCIIWICNGHTKYGLRNGWPEATTVGRSLLYLPPAENTVTQYLYSSSKRLMELFSY